MLHQSGVLMNPSDQAKLAELSFGGRCTGLRCYILKYLGTLQQQQVLGLAWHGSLAPVPIAAGTALPSDLYGGAGTRVNWPGL